jgi:hypothetical protein
MNLKQLLAQARDVLLTRMIRIQSGHSETCIALRSVVKFHFKLGLEHCHSDIFVALVDEEELQRVQRKQAFASVEDSLDESGSWLLPLFDGGNNQQF